MTALKYKVADITLADFGRLTVGLEVAFKTRVALESSISVLGLGLAV